MEIGLGISLALAYPGVETAGGGGPPLPAWIVVPGDGTFMALMSSPPSSPVIVSTGDGMFTVEVS